MRGIPAFVSSLVVAVAFAAPVSFAGRDDLSRWLTRYYRQPVPEQAADAIEAASRMGVLREGATAPPIFGFLAGLLATEPGIARSLVGRLSALPTADQPVVVLGVWYSGHPDTRELLATLARAMPGHQAMIEGFASGSAPRLTEIPLEEGAWVLDALWGNFLASGDDAPVVRIMAALPWTRLANDRRKLLVGGAARWSLKSNAVQHARVLDICRAQLPRQPRDVAAVLAEVVAEAERELAARS